MPTPLEIKKANRARLMRRLYDATDGDPLARVARETLLADLDLSESQARELVHYLKAEGLVKVPDFGGNLSITHAGVVEVEQSLEQPERPTQHFPPAATVLQIFGNVAGSNIAQGSPQASQTATYTTEQREELSEALVRVKALLDQDLLDDEDERAVRADVQTAEVQLASPRPNRAVLVAVATSIVNVLSVVGGDNELVQAAVEALRPFLGT